MRSSHLLTVWNPSYADSAIDAHLAVLLDWAERRARGDADDDDVYVWWAKLRSPNRQQPLPHREQILALQEQIDRDVETHLYLTDYRSLFVAHLDEISEEDLLTGEVDQRGHMPDYYVGMHADFWFLIDDVRLLVADDTVATIEELKKLRNARYHDRPVSLYGGMVDLPLIVWRDDEPSWFGAAAAPAEDGKLWAERDSETRSEVARLGRELRDNLFGREVWGALGPASRTFLAAAEATFRARRDDPRFDFSGPVMGYAKAVETELNGLLFPALRRAFRSATLPEREVAIDGRTLDIGARVPHQTLGVMRNLLLHNETVRKGVRAAFSHDEKWLLSVVPGMLLELEEVRNPAAHSEPSVREVVGRLRDRVMGVGEEGLIARMARARMRSG